jgi:hypothetical protein
MSLYESNLKKFEHALITKIKKNYMLQEIFTVSLIWTGFKPKKYKNITFKQRIFY